MTDNRNEITTVSHTTVSDRLRYLIVTLRKSQAEFARLIQVDPGNLSKMLTGRTRLSSKMLDRIASNTGCSLQWLMYGTDVPFAKEGNAGMKEIEKSGSEQISTDASQGGAPVYDIDVTAGAMELSRMFTQDRVIGWLNMPNLTPGLPLVRVSGESMKPRISDGSYVQIRQVAVSGTIFWGQTYVVVLDDYRMVKILRRHSNPSMVILHSLNPDYDDMEVLRTEIRNLFIVEAVFNYDVLA